MVRAPNSPQGRYPAQLTEGYKEASIRIRETESRPVLHPEKQMKQRVFGSALQQSSPQEKAQNGGARARCWTHCASQTPRGEKRDVVERLLQGFAGFAPPYREREEGYIGV